MSFSINNAFASLLLAFPLHTAIMDVIVGNSSIKTTNATLIYVQPLTALGSTIGDTCHTAITSVDIKGRTIIIDGVEVNSEILAELLETQQQQLSEIGSQQLPGVVDHKDSHQLSWLDAILYIRAFCAESSLTIKQFYGLLCYFSDENDSAMGLYIAGLVPVENARLIFQSLLSLDQIAEHSLIDWLTLVQGQSTSSMRPPSIAMHALLAPILDDRVKLNAMKMFLSQRRPPCHEDSIAVIESFADKSSERVNAILLLKKANGIGELKRRERNHLVRTCPRAHRKWVNEQLK